MFYPVEIVPATSIPWCNIKFYVTSTLKRWIVVINDLWRYTPKVFNP